MARAAGNRARGLALRLVRLHIGAPQNLFTLSIRELDAAVVSPTSVRSLPPRWGDLRGGADAFPRWSKSVRSARAATDGAPRFAPRRDGSRAFGSCGEDTSDICSMIWVRSLRNPLQVDLSFGDDQRLFSFEAIRLRAADGGSDPVPPRSRRRDRPLPGRRDRAAAHCARGASSATSSRTHAGGESV
jgi:hypothetical protein